MLQIPTGTVYVSSGPLCHEPATAARPARLGRPAAEQRDEADEGRMEAERGMVGGSRHSVVVSKHHGAGARPSQLIASVLRARGGAAGRGRIRV